MVYAQKISHKFYVKYAMLKRIIHVPQVRLTCELNCQQISFTSKLAYSMLPNILLSLHKLYEYMVGYYTRKNNFRYNFIE